jgi:O-acetylserine/cysteine efflux transporter
VGTVVAFGIYFWLLRYAPAYKLSLIAYVVPAIALTLGTLLGEEPLGWHTALGTGLVLAGVGAVYVGRRGSTETSSRAAPGPD